MSVVHTLSKCGTNNTQRLRKIDFFTTPTFSFSTISLHGWSCRLQRVRETVEWWLESIIFFFRLILHNLRQHLAQAVHESTLKNATPWQCKLLKTPRYWMFAEDHEPLGHGHIRSRSKNEKQWTRRWFFIPSSSPIHRWPRRFKHARHQNPHTTRRWKLQRICFSLVSSKNPQSPPDYRQNLKAKLHLSALSYDILDA